MEATKPDTMIAPIPNQNPKRAKPSERRRGGATTAVIGRWKARKPALDTPTRNTKKIDSQITGAIAVMAGFTGGVSVAEVAGVLLIYGIGAGLFQSPNISGVLGAAPADRLGVASGTLSTLGRLGQVVGVAVAGGIWEQQTPAAQAGGDVEAFTTAFLVLALVGALATAASWVRGPVALQEDDHLHPPPES